MRASSTLYERVEELHGFKFIKLKSGRQITFWDALDATKAAHTALGLGVSRALKLVDDSDELDLDRLETFVWHLEAHVAAIRAEIERRRGVRFAEERIARLRMTAGRTPEEAAMFCRKADELEQRLASDGR